MHLVIGGRGLIGCALCNELGARKLDWTFTSRRPDAPIRLDLRDPNLNMLPDEVAVLYLVAGVVGYSPCEDDPDAWRVNVDAPIMLANRYPFAFVVFISSDVVEKKGTAAYQVQKRTAESYMRTIYTAIIRPGRVGDRAAELAKVIVDVGLAQKPGIVRWPS